MSQRHSTSREGHMRIVTVLAVLLCLALTFGAVSCDNGADTDTDSDTLTVSNVTSADATTSSVIITWATNEGATSQVWYGTSESYGSSSTVDTTLVTAHTVTLAGLTDGTTYHYRVRSEDAIGNVASSDDGTFNTLLSMPTILSHTSFLCFRSYHVIGELQNNSSNRLSVKVTATLYNSAGTVVSTIGGGAGALANEKSAFEFTEVNEDIAAQVDHYSLALSDPTVTQTQVEPYGGLTILSHSGGNAGFGMYEVRGEVKNTGDQAIGVEVRGVFYDKDGKVVDVGNDYYLNPLQVGQRTSFTILLVCDTQTPKIASYELHVEGIPLP